ncbi:MAG: hypothetical protein EPO26_03185 [Chloroflexota bacterium]|nr:MAG: hypothetical protein EPO26_03185 [Chloroflexota bacterium]
MGLTSRSSRLGRRALLRWGALAAGAAVVGPIVQACQQPAPTPQIITKEVIVEKPVDRVVTKEVIVEKPVERVVTKEVTVSKEILITPTPRLKSKVTGNLQIVQQRGFNPLQTTFIHNLVLRTSAESGWPLDKSYVEAFTAGSNIYEKMAAQVAANDSPDLFIGNEDTFQMWNLKVIQPVDDVVAWAEKAYGKTAPLQKLNNFIDGKWYAVPTWIATGGWWARKSWFDEISWDVKKQYSLQEWLDTCIKVTNVEKKRWGFGNTVNRSGDGNTNVGFPVYAAGGRLTTADNKVAFNSPETVAGYEWIKDIYTSPKYQAAMPPGINSWTDPSNNEAYLAGTIGFSSNGGTMFATAMARAKEIAQDTYLVPHPTGPAGKKDSLIVAGPYGFHNHIFRGAKNTDAAKEMLQTLLSKENQIAIWDNSPGLAMPAYEWGWDEKTFQQVPNNIIGLSKALVYSDKVFNNFQPGNQPKLWINAVGSENVLTDTMAAILKGTAVKDAVADAHARMVKIHEKFEGR